MVAIFILVLVFIALVWWAFYVRLTTGQGAPYIPLEREVVKEVIKLADIKADEIFYDLGSGDGRVVIAAAAAGARSYGVEIDKLRIAYSRLMIRLAGLDRHATILEQDIFATNLAHADVVFLFLLPETNEKLEQKLEQELKPGARVISAAFHFPNWKPLTINPNGPQYGPIYYYER